MDNNKDKKIGAVLVQGGGIAGIQAALDLANSGFKVYLIERSAAIGGMMSHLDKTFPTGDCATCIVSPKLVECARNLNIEILTLSELTDLKGKPGNFKATIKRHPRFVDEARCNACSQCTEVCPVNIPNRFDRNLGTRKAIAKHYAQAIPNIFNILKLGKSPCSATCPAGVNAHGYVALISQGRFKEALEVLRRAMPFVGVCGRVCTHPCETECERGKVDEPIAIGALKRFMADYEIKKGRSKAAPVEKTKKERVAIVGSGPAGIACAYDLVRGGYPVTVFEAAPMAGGMLRYSIPEYRLPRNIVDNEINYVRELGVEIKTNHKVQNLDEIFRQGYSAIFLATGAWVSQRLGIPGEDARGVIHALDFLKKVSENAKVDLGSKVSIIGGGNAAVDAARTALRLGAKEVNVIYRRSRAEMPAIASEIEKMEQEGIKIQFLAAPVEITAKNGNSAQVKCIRMELGEPDTSGRRHPVPIKGSEFGIEVDNVIVAIGQTVDQSILPENIGLSDSGTVSIDPITFETSVKGVFAGGDVVSGPADVINAIAAGKEAAISIDRFLRGTDIGEGRPKDRQRVKDVPKQGVQKKARATMPALGASERSRSFKEVELGFSEETAIQEASRCLNCAVCSECVECVKVCDQNAIDHDMRERTIELEVGSVILAPGFEEFRAEKKGEFGFGRYPNVLTSVQFERMLSASGPFEGRVIRRSDGLAAKRVAWIQCVGSRDSKCGNDYCSSVCCMVSTKQAMVALDHTPELDASIFYMDIRAHGKDFDQYYERARKKENIHYIKSIPSRVLQVPGTKDLRLRFYGEDGKLQELDFDLVVLSVGMEAGASTKETMKRLGIDLNDYGFCATDRFTPLSTSKPGVFVAGAFQEPKDIPETVTQASAAASMSMELLATARNSLITKRVYPDEHDVTDEEPRIGVFVCHCGKNIASVVDVERVAEIASQQPNVVFATHTMYTCADSNLNNIKDMIREHRLNRIVVASCTPRTHEPIFRDTLREAGLNPYLFELANIRDQCSWVHSLEPGPATEKAADLMKMAVARARLLSPLTGTSFSVNQTGLVIGGGISGMTAALALANQGFRVHLVEKSSRLGGNALGISYTLEHEDVSEFLSGLVNHVENHPNIILHLETQVTGVAGFIGAFQITLCHDGKDIDIPCGAVIVATGANAAKTEEFLYGKSSLILTQAELEQRLQNSAFITGNQNVVMIQCVGSRNDERAYCSRICCSMAVKNALKIKKQDPRANVYVLYRDIRTYGFREKYYTQAREAGVVFIRYDRDVPPEVSESNGLFVTVKSPDFPEPIEIEADHVVLSTGVEATGNRRLADMLKVPLNADGFFVEAHLKLRPVDFATEGVFLCGLAHSPKMIDENISQARAAAARAATVLSKTFIEVGAQVSYVDQSKCISCMTCIKVCPYGAPSVNVDRKAEIISAKCMGCGICAAECPACAIQLNHFESRQFKTMLDELLKVQGVENIKPVGVLQ